MRSAHHKPNEPHAAHVTARNAASGRRRSSRKPCVDGQGIPVSAYRPRAVDHRISTLN